MVGGFFGAGMLINNVKCIQPLQSVLDEILKNNKDVCAFNYHIFNLRRNLNGSSVTHMQKSIQAINFLFSPKPFGNSSDKVYLSLLRLLSVLSALAYFGADSICVRRFQPGFQQLFFAICEFIRSFVDFVFRKLSFIARFLMFFSL